jgi:hypothetical protein
MLVFLIRLENKLKIIKKLNIIFQITFKIIMNYNKNF